jgi:hypothetical protein
MLKLNGKFTRLTRRVKRGPASPTESAIRAKLAKIGVGPSKSFQFKDLPPDHRREIELGMRDGETKVKEYLGGELFKVNGWSVRSVGRRRVL